MAQPLEQPQPQPQKAFPVSWDQFHRDARALAWRLAGAGPFQAIVCVTRGGLVPAAIVARELGIRLIETVCVSSYNHITQGELKVLKDVARSIVGIGGGRGKGVLMLAMFQIPNKFYERDGRVTDVAGQNWETVWGRALKQ